MNAYDTLESYLPEYGLDDVELTNDDVNYFLDLLAEGYTIDQAADIVLGEILEHLGETMYEDFN